MPKENKRLVRLFPGEPRRRRFSSRPGTGLGAAYAQLAADRQPERLDLPVRAFDRGKLARAAGLSPMQNKANSWGVRACTIRCRLSRLSNHG